MDAWDEFLRDAKQFFNNKKISGCVAVRDTAGLHDVMKGVLAQEQKNKKYCSLRVKS